MAGRVTLDELLAAASRRIDRLQAAEAHAEAGRGALIVDIRSLDARRRDGVVPGSLHLPRTVLEWRCEPGGAWRSPHVGGLESRLVVLCDHGYSSVLAAASLAELGYRRAADVVGGFAAWRDAGLPVAVAREPEPGEIPGLGPPDPVD